jgi:hypothetical protein
MTLYIGTDSALQKRHEGIENFLNQRQLSVQNLSQADLLYDDAAPAKEPGITYDSAQAASKEFRNTFWGSMTRSYTV